MSGLGDLKVRDDPPWTNEHGYSPTPRPPKRQYGSLVGLPGRLSRWASDLGTNRSWPWHGLGLIRDLEVVVQLLNLREFAEWLRTKGGEHAQWADDILRDQETLECVTDALQTAGRQEDDPVRGVELLDEECRKHEADAKVADDMRQVLVDVGALGADDTTTPLPDLLRMLLS